MITKTKKKSFKYTLIYEIDASANKKEVISMFKVFMMDTKVKFKGHVMSYTKDNMEFVKQTCIKYASENGCHFEQQNPEGFGKCGAPTVNGSSYCAEHLEWGKANGIIR